MAVKRSIFNSRSNSIPYYVNSDGYEDIIELSLNDYGDVCVTGLKPGTAVIKYSYAASDGSGEGELIGSTTITVKEYNVEDIELEDTGTVSAGEYSSVSYDIIAAEEVYDVSATVESSDESVLKILYSGYEYFE